MGLEPRKRKLKLTVKDKGFCDFRSPKFPRNIIFQNTNKCQNGTKYLQLFIYSGENIPEDLNIFPVNYNSQPLCEQLVLVSSKERYTPSYSKYFLKLLCGYFNKLEQIRMENKAIN